MSYNLVLNSDNVIGANNTTFQFKFINGSFTIPEDSFICISNLTIPYAWFNITTGYNNNAFNIIDWLGVTHNIVLPNGFYTQSDIQNYIQEYCLNNGLYLINGNSDPVFYLFLVTNTNYYADQILTYTVPSALPSGWTVPGNFIGFPVTPTAPTFQVLNNNFTKVIGFNAGLYGGGSVDKSFLSQFAPNTTSINSLIVSLNLVSNPVQVPTNIIDNVPITSEFGTNIVYEPKFEKFVKIQKGTYSNFILQILDQNFNSIQSQDPNATISLLLKLGKP